MPTHQLCTPTMQRGRAAYILRTLPDHAVDHPDDLWNLCAPGTTAPLKPTAPQESQTFELRVGSVAAKNGASSCAPFGLGLLQTAQNMVGCVSSPGEPTFVGQYCPGPQAHQAERVDHTGMVHHQTIHHCLLSSNGYIATTTTSNLPDNLTGLPGDMNTADGQSPKSTDHSNRMALSPFLSLTTNTLATTLSISCSGSVL